MAGAPPPNPVTIEEGWEKEILPKAIQPLEKILNEGLQDRQKRDLFGPKEYVHIYTYVIYIQKNGEGGVGRGGRRACRGKEGRKEGRKAGGKRPERSEVVLSVCAVQTY
jgi:hypothetical protein